MTGATTRRAAEPRRVASGRVDLVGEEAEDADADVRAPFEHAQDLRGGLPAPDDDRVALVVAAAPGEAQRLAEDGAREAHEDDRLRPEERDHDARVVVTTKREGH